MEKLVTGAAVGRRDGLDRVRFDDRRVVGGGVGGRQGGSVVCAPTWMVGPSARGSEYGTPSSMTSDPASSRMRTAFSVVSMPPSPAQMNGMKAHCPRFLRSSKVLGMDSVFAAMARVTTNLRPVDAEDRAARMGATLAPAKAEAWSACAIFT